MPENMMNSAHKATNKSFRDGYDEIFRNRKFKSIKLKLKKIIGPLTITYPLMQDLMERYGWTIQQVKNAGYSETEWGWEKK